MRLGNDCSRASLIIFVESTDLTIAELDPNRLRMSFAMLTILLNLTIFESFGIDKQVRDTNKLSISLLHANGFGFYRGVQAAWLSPIPQHR